MAQLDTVNEAIKNALEADNQGMNNVAAALVSTATNGTDVVLPNLYDASGNALHITVGGKTEIGAAELFAIGRSGSVTEIKDQTLTLAPQKIDTFTKNAVRDAKG